MSQSKGLSYKTRETPEALHDSEMRDRRPVQAGRDGILMLDADNGKIMDANPLMISSSGIPWLIRWHGALGDRIFRRRCGIEGGLQVNYRRKATSARRFDVENCRRKANRR